MKPFGVYVMFLALKMHFTKPDYDYFKYNGKVRASVDSFEKRNDKYYFYRMSKHKDPQYYLLANILNQPHIQITDMFTEKSEKVLKEYLRDTQSLSYNFKRDLNLLDPDFNSNFVVEDGQRPNLLKLYNQGMVSIYTMVILNRLVGYINLWETKISDPIVWPDTKLKLIKYQPFLSFPEQKFKDITKAAFSQHK